MKIDKYYLSLAGEFRICSELLKRGVFATVIFGNKKGADIFAVGRNRKAAQIEVKSSNSNRFVTKFYQKHRTPDDEHPNFWVLFSVCEKNDAFIERFFVLTHQEMAEAQAQRNHPEEKLTWAERANKVTFGVDNVIHQNVEAHESQWDKIIHFCNDA